jgi:hypothetical protein
MWTRKVAAPVVAVAMAALFAVIGSPAAASGPVLREAATGELSVRAARRLARRLEAKQHEQRLLLFTDLGRPRRRSPQRIDFSYRDRSASDVLCRARIVVVQDGDSRRAAFRNVRCNGIASQYLDFEKAARDLGKAVRRRASDVRESIRGYERSFRECDDVVVPRDRRDEFDLLVFAGLDYAFYTPLRDRLGRFVRTLREVRPGDPVLARGVLAWDRILALVDALPAAAADPCAALREWADGGFTDETAPADFDALRVTRRHLYREQRKLYQTVNRLLFKGVLERAASTFTPNDLFVLIQD